MVEMKENRSVVETCIMRMVERGCEAVGLDHSLDTHNMFICNRNIKELTTCTIPLIKSFCQWREPVVCTYEVDDPLQLEVTMTGNFSKVSELVEWLEQRDIDVNFIDTSCEAQFKLVKKRLGI